MAVTAALAEMTKVISICCCVLIGVPAFVHAEESVTIATYYPSPQGVYKKLRLYPTSEDSVGVCSSNQDEGRVYYNNSVHELKICTNSSGVYSFRSLGGASGSFWNYSAGNLFPADSSWNITFPASVSTGYQHKIKVDLVSGQDMWIGNSTNSIVQLGWESNNALIKGVGGGSNARGLSFFTGSESSNSRRMTINATGSVAIGTDTPQGLLHVNGTTIIDGSIYANNTNWQNVNLTSPWTNYDSGYQHAQYKKVGDLVFIRGTVRLNDSESLGKNTLIFILPPGFSPATGTLSFRRTGPTIYKLLTREYPAYTIHIVPGGGCKYAATDKELGSFFPRGAQISLDGIVFSTD